MPSSAAAAKPALLSASAYEAAAAGGPGVNVTALVASDTAFDGPDARLVLKSLRAANFTGSCVVVSGSDMDAVVRTLYANGTTFVALLQSPGPTTLASNLSIVNAPAWWRRPPATLRKVGWMNAVMYYPPSVVMMLLAARFPVPNASLFVGANGSPVDYYRYNDNASSTIVQLSGPAGVVLAATITAAVPLVHEIFPVSGPPSGGVVVLLNGKGFGAIPPVFMVASIGGAPCGNVTWRSENTISCVAPPGIGIDQTVALRVGYQAAAFDANASFSYEPATLSFVLSADTGMPATTLVAGANVFIIGRNFANQVTMQCRFGDALVLASYLNDSCVECRTPITANGILDVFVTNDATRYSNGFQFGVLAYTAVRLQQALDVAGAGIVWTGHTRPSTSLVPFDFDGSVVPAALSIALLFTSSWRQSATATVDMALAAVRASGSILPFTNFSARFYDISAALDPTLMTSVLSRTMRSVRDDAGDAFVGVIGPAERLVCCARAALSSR